MPGPWEKYGQQPSRPVIRRGPTAPSGYQYSGDSLQPIPGGPADPNIRPPEKPNLPVGYRMGSGGRAERIPGLPMTTDAATPKISAKERADAIQAYTDADALERLAANLEAQFGAGVGATSGVAGLQDYLPTETNRKFNDTSFQGRGRVKRALGFTGGEGNTIGEIGLNYGPFLPEASNFDGQITNKIDALRGLAQDSRARAIAVLGGAPDANGVVTPVEEQIDAPAPAQTIDVPQGFEAAAPRLAPSAGKTRSVIDPQAQELAGEIGAMLSRGDGRGQIIGHAIRSDPTLKDDPKFRAALDDAIKFRASPGWKQWQRLNPGRAYPFSPEFYTREEPLGNVERGLTKAAQTAPGAYLARAGDAVTAGNLDRIAGLAGADPEGARMALDLARRENPTASLAGDVTGGVMAALMGEAGLARLGMAPGLARGVVADAGYGGTTYASNAQDGSALTNFGKGALIGGAGSLGGQGLLRGIGATAKGVTAPSVRYVNEMDVPLTIGQSVGQSGRVGSMVKGIEDRVAGLPIVGDAINARRLEGLAKMNSKAFDRALEPIGENVAGQYAEDAVETAQQKISGAFQRALGGKVATLDRRFIVEAEKAKMMIEKLPARVSGEVDNQVNDVISNYFDDAGNLSGENMQALLRELDAVKRGYRQDPLGHRIGKSVDAISDTIENLFRRQAPEVMPQYDAAKKAFKRLSTLEDAVLRAKNSGGVFTPAQLGMSDRASTVKFGGKHAAAAGKGEFHDMQRATQEVMPNKVPDSGTAGRLALPLAAMGAGAGAENFGGVEGGTATGLSLAALLTLAYSRLGQRALVGGVSRRGPTAQAIGRGAKRAARVGGAVGATTALPGTYPSQ